MHWNILPILLFSISTTLTPGPNNFMIMNSALHFGVKRSIPHYLGISFGFPTMILVVAFGFGALFVHFHWLHTALKILGGIYMLYLAWVVASSSTKNKDSKKYKPLTFLQAALFQWVNPKAWMMAVGSIALFTTVGGDYFYQVLFLSILFCAMCLICVGIWMILGSVMNRLLKNDLHRRIFNYAMAICLVASVVLIVFE